MLKRKVYIDTNIIIEAFRINCWPAICQSHALETVEKCVKESLTGKANKNNIHIDRSKLINGLSKLHKVQNKARAELSLAHPFCEGLDDGELHLFALLYEQKYNPDFLIATADKAAIVAAIKLGWIDSLTCLEQIMQVSGISKQQNKNLANHHRNIWLNNIKCPYLVEIL